MKLSGKPNRNCFKSLMKAWTNQQQNKNNKINGKIDENQLEKKQHTSTLKAVTANNSKTLIFFSRFFFGNQTLNQSIDSINEMLNCNNDL